LDETGAIARDRFFAVGCLKLTNPSALTRAVQALRDKRHWYSEIHFTELNRNSVPHYEALVNVIAGLRAEFSCFIADREAADPIQRYGTPWKAYEAMATQLLIGSIHKDELVTVLADEYSTPANVVFETDVKREVNRRLDCLAVTSVCRLKSDSADPLQIVDFLTGAVAFEFRAANDLAGPNTPKARVAELLRARLGIKTFMNGVRTTRATGLRMNVEQYRAPAKRKTPPAPRSR